MRRQFAASLGCCILVLASAAPIAAAFSVAAIVGTTICHESPPSPSFEAEDRPPSLGAVEETCYDHSSVVPLGNASDAPAVSGSSPTALLAADAAILAVARGGRYVAEGNGPNDFDCSGLTAWAWRQAGVYLADYSYTQREQTLDIARSAVAPGDLVFWFGGSEHHVAIVVDVAGPVIRIAEAANPTAGLRIRELGGPWDEAYLTGFGRVVS